MDNIIETENYKGFQIGIYADGSPESPREWDNFGIMIYKKNNHYKLGDFEIPAEFFCDAKGVYLDTDTQENILIWAEQEYGEIATFLPVYVYEHSGIVLNTKGFSCQWDSGQCGYIIATKKAVKEAYSVKRISKKIIQRVQETLKNEVKTFSDYASGEVYGYVVEEIEDSCWSFYGYDHEKSGLLECARENIDYYITNKNKAKAEKLKQLIKNHVPLSTREAVLQSLNKTI